MTNIISCKTAMFGDYETAFHYFPQADVFHAECPSPADKDFEKMARAADAAKITIQTLSTGLNLDSDETAASFPALIDNAALIGVPKIFVSAKASSDELFDAALSRLGELAKYAWSKGVVICMETHPPFAENADKGRLVIERIDCPGLRYNFDTANIYYYNENCDSVVELQKIADYVASVHLKDTDGGFKSPNFPPVGKGIVDFPKVFEILAENNFSGPYTLEIEGANVSALDKEGRLQFLKDCITYLRQAGVMD